MCFCCFYSATLFNVAITALVTVSSGSSCRICSRRSAYFSRFVNTFTVTVLCPSIFRMFPMCL